MWRPNTNFLTCHASKQTRIARECEKEASSGQNGRTSKTLQNVSFWLQLLWHIYLYIYIYTKKIPSLTRHSSRKLWQFFCRDDAANCDRKCLGEPFCKHLGQYGCPHDFCTLESHYWLSASEEALIIIMLLVAVILRVSFLRLSG